MACSNVHKSPLWKCERAFLATVHPQTNRGSGLKRCLLKSIVHSWRRPGFFLLWSCFEKVLALQNYYQELNMEGSRTVWAILGAESVTEAGTSQLCFHSFMQGGGRGGGGGGMRNQQWINLTALIQISTSYHLSPGFYLTASNGELWCCDSGPKNWAAKRFFWIESVNQFSLELTW